MIRIILLLFVGGLLFGCSKDADNGVAIEDESTQSAEIDIKVTVKDGILSFENAEDLFEVLSILDTLSPEHRKNWEDNVGFKSIRSLYDEVTDRFYNGEDWISANEEGLITLVGNDPVITDYTIAMAPILNREGVVMVGGALGTHRRDGSYWVENASYLDLQALVKSKKIDQGKGRFAFVNPMADESFMREKSCSGGFPNVLYDQTFTLSNGENNGSSRLRGTLSFNYTVSLPIGSGSAASNYIKVFFKLSGISERKTRNEWRLKRHDHSFSWNFVVRHIESIPTPQGPEVVSDTETSYSGSEVHYDNQVASKEVVILEGYNLVGWMPNNSFILERVNPGNIGSGTSQTTNYLAPNAIIYDCD